jgi:hypothetical protein
MIALQTESQQDRYQNSTSIDASNIDLLSLRLQDQNNVEAKSEIASILFQKVYCNLLSIFDRAPVKISRSLNSQLILFL